jgi:peptidoglycan L-alanyl-D-glutamate endopeptidase CwlK
VENGLTELTRRDFACKLSATIGCAAILAPAAAQASLGTACAYRPLSLAQNVERLVAAYPLSIASGNEREIVWQDGMCMQVQLFSENRPISEQLAHPDLASQISQMYPLGNCEIPTDPTDDPGRVRYDPFFKKMYGNSSEAVRSSLTRIPWPGRKPGTAIEITRVNGVDQHLSKVAQKLAALPQEYHRFFDNPAGGFYWRPIAGTNRLSAHSFGIAIDINVDMSDYWRNEVPGSSGEPPDWQQRRARNRIPRAVVEAFENHNFIWGGKWFHYDTMHFEYRPEMLMV